MAILIEEKKDHKNCSYYLVKYDEEPNKILKTVKYTVYKSKVNEILFFNLYDVRMKPNDSVFEYVNFYLLKDSENTREKIIHSIKLLLVYCDLFNVDINKMKSTDVLRFEYFITGITETGIAAYKLKLITARTPKRVKEIINDCRLYVKHRRFKNYNLFVASAATRQKVHSGAAYYVGENARNYGTCPPFITVDEFDKLVEYFKNSNYMEETKLKYICMISIMFKCGLRIGETLGLTLQDFEELQASNGKSTIGIIIRNRASDQKFQNAKTVCSITSTKEYDTEYYRTYNVGYQTAVISQQLYTSIFEYVEMSRMRFDSNNAIVKDYADDVTGKNEENSYIFLNEKTRSPIRGDSFNRVVKKAFRACGIVIDDEKTNVCHKFRHGFVMHMLYDLNMRPEDVIHYSRHTTVNGLKPYITPSKEYYIEKMNELSEIIDKGGEPNE